MQMVYVKIHTGDPGPLGDENLYSGRISALLDLVGPQMISNIHPIEFPCHRKAKITHVSLWDSDGGHRANDKLLKKSRVLSWDTFIIRPGDLKIFLTFPK